MKKLLQWLYGFFGYSAEEASEIVPDLDPKAELLREMPGTEGTGEYIVLLATALGRVGIRRLGSHTYRVRVEPTLGSRPQLHQALLNSDGWKQPSSSQDRFSRVAWNNTNQAAQIVLVAIHALRVSGGVQAVNTEAPDQFLALTGVGTDDELVAEFLRITGSESDDETAEGVAEADDFSGEEEVEPEPESDVEVEGDVPETEVIADESKPEGEDLSGQTLLG